MNHIEFLQNPDLWPNWPICPVKRWVGDNMQTGVVLAVEGHLSTVFLTNMFMLSGTLKDLIDNSEIERIKYQDLETLYRAGWQVD